jgi:hypothetical protein
MVFARDDLRDPVAVAHIDEHDPAHVAHAMDPAEQHDVAPGIARAERAARMGPPKVAQGFYVNAHKSGLDRHL